MPRMSETNPIATAKDPVCGMAVDPEATPHRYEWRGRPYFFCCNACLQKFVVDPQATLDRPANDSEPEAALGARYTCPMHPEVVQDGPGDCPDCGMALEPMVATGAEAPNPELIDMSRRFWVGLVFSSPVLALAMGAHLPDPDAAAVIGHRAVNWAQCLLSTPVVLWAGWPFLQRGWTSIVTRRLNMFTLIAIGVAAAYLYSFVALFVPGWFPDAFRSAAGHVDVYFEASAVIVTLVLLGQVLELRARSQTGSAIRALLDLAPATARRLDDCGGAETEIPLAEIVVDDRLDRKSVV